MIARGITTGLPILLLRMGYLGGRTVGETARRGMDLNTDF